MTCFPRLGNFIHLPFRLYFPSRFPNLSTLYRCFYDASVLKDENSQIIFCNVWHKEIVFSIYYMKNDYFLIKYDSVM